MNPALAALIARPIAHRGLHDAASGVTENGLAAARAAIAAGYGIEIDVQLSADGEAIVIHDDMLDRTTTGAGPVSSKTTAEIAALSLRGEATGEGPPSLSALLDLVGAAQTPLVIEVKDQSGTYGPVDGRLEARVAEATRNRAAPITVMSFNPHSVARLAAEAPDIPRGLVAGRFVDVADQERRRDLEQLAAFERVGASFISYQWDALPTAETSALRAAGIPVICWTIRSPEASAAAFAHADQITFEGFAP